MIPAPQAPSNVQQSTNVAAWTEQAIDALQSVNLSAEAAQRAPRRTSVTITVPLDERHESGPRGADGSHNYGSRQAHTTYGRSEPVPRDSLKRREALLKGKEGSRQRRRWENGSLVYMNDLSGVVY